MASLRALPRTLWVLVAGTTITHAGALVFAYLTIYLSSARGLGLDVVGGILAAGSAGLVIGNVAGGWTADRLGRKPTLLLALTINILGLLALSQPHDHAVTYGAWLWLSNLGTGMYSPAASALIADETPEALRPLAYTTNYVATNLGMALGPLLGGALASVSYTWLFVGDAITTMICAGLIAAGVRSDPISPSCSGAAPVREGHLAVWMAHRGVLGFCGASFFVIAPLMGLEYAVPLLVHRTFGAELIWVGAIYTLNAVCILALGFLIERWIRGRAEAASMVMAAVFWTAGLLVFALGFSLVTLVLCTAVWTIGEIIASIVIPSYIARRVPRRFKGRMMAVGDVVRSVAGMAAPLVLGVVWQAHGVAWVVTVVVALPACGAVVYLGIAVMERQARRALG